MLKYLTKKMPKASVIISVWNDARHIASCIESIKCQSMEDFECLIVDDGSIDNTFEVASNAIANDNRFRILKIPHEGLSNARNVGFSNSKADIIFHVDADDEAVPKMLEYSIKFLEENELEMAIFDAIVNVNDSMPSKHAIQRYFNRCKCYGISSGKQMLQEMIFNGDYNYSVFLQAAKRSAVRCNFHYGLRAQDMLYTTQNLFLAKRVGHLSKLLYIKNEREDSISNSRHDAKYVWSFLKIFTELQKFAEEVDEHSITLAQVVAQAFDCLTFGIRNLEEEDWKVINKMSFTDRTTLLNLRKLLYAPAIRKQFDKKAFLK